jgi:nuclear receptor subfamily 1 group I
MLKNMLNVTQQKQTSQQPQLAQPVSNECLSAPTSTTNCGQSLPDSLIRETDYVFEDIEDRPIEPNTIESILSQAIRLEYESPVQPNVNSSIELNDAERAKLNELIVANKALYQPVDEDLQSLISDECIKVNYLISGCEMSY